jgi:predicted Zn-dependent peptidase
VADAREALMREFETNSQENRFVLNRLVYGYQYGGVEEAFNLRPLVDRLTASLIRDAARTYLDTRRYVEVTLLPEARKP